MRTIKVIELKPGMTIWCPGNDNLHKKTIAHSIQHHRANHGAGGIEFIFICNSRVFFSREGTIEIIDPKLVPML
jgi:hypothetical protein